MRQEVEEVFEFGIIVFVVTIFIIAMISSIVHENKQYNSTHEAKTIIVTDKKCNKEQSYVWVGGIPNTIINYHCYIYANNKVYYTKDINLYNSLNVGGSYNVITYECDGIYKIR